MRSGLTGAIFEGRRRMRIHSRYRALLLALFTLLAWAGSAKAEVADLGTLHRQILEILHGEPRSDVVPSPYYCFRHGLGSEDPNIRDFEWYVSGKGQCSATYVPNLASIHLPSLHLTEAKYLRLEESLTTLADVLEKTPLALGDRFDLQMTLWVLIVTLRHSGDIMSPPDPRSFQAKLDRLLVPALRALQATLFTHAQIDALPETLSQLAELSGDPGIEPLARKLLAGDGSFLEDRFPHQFHSRIAESRVFSRVFVTIDDPAELERLRGYLSQRANLRLEGLSWQSAPPLAEKELKRAHHGDLLELPQRFSGVHTILLLFFNVLDTCYKVVPTRMIAAWQEMQYSGKVNSPVKLRALDPVLRLRIVNYQKQLGLRDNRGARYARDFPSYRRLSEDELSRLFPPDVNPGFPNTNVTTVRGQCFGCHPGQLGSFRVFMRNAGFARPFSARPEELSYVERETKMGEAFRKWSLEYLGKTQEPKTSKPPDPGTGTPP